jgi:hypothetical protein
MEPSLKNEFLSGLGSLEDDYDSERSQAFQPGVTTRMNTKLKRLGDAEWKNA